MSRIPTDTFLGMMRLNALTTRKVSVMQCTTIPFTLVRADESYILDVDQIFMEAAQLTDGRKPRGCRYSLALPMPVAVYRPRRRVACCPGRKVCPHPAAK